MLGASFFYLLITIAILMYIIKNTWQHVYDNIHLRGEILIGCIILCVTIGIEFIIFGIDVVGGYHPENEKFTQVFNFGFFFITSMACFSLIIVSTQYVRIQVNAHEVTVNKTILHRGNTDLIHNGVIDENVWIMADEVDFQALISTPNGLVEFLDHLAREYELNYLVVK